ncbi:Hypothetical protein, putative, partial [Bodo saltans]
MEADLVAGTLGRLFDSADVMTVPQVKTTLYEKMEDLRHRSSAFETSAAFQLMQSTLSVTEVLQDFCASDAEVQRLKKRKLRLRTGDGLGGENAHLRDLQVDDDGNIIGAGLDLTAGDVDAKRVPLKAFELVQLATLMPVTVEEAVALIPSLEVYNEE